MAKAMVPKMREKRAIFCGVCIGGRVVELYKLVQVVG
jgi:aerobic-type carbon monoxide dehydrogenase small subunit (CoxS/CutS family)